MHRSQSFAFQALRASSRRLLRYCETKISENNGEPATIYNDEFEIWIGTRLVFLPALCELDRLGLLTVQRFPKHHIVALADGWRDIQSLTAAQAASRLARKHRALPLPTGQRDGRRVA